MSGSQKKHDILQAASECFIRFGYDKTTMDDIGRMVGLNKASLYYYYKNKETIFAEVILSEAEELVQVAGANVQELSCCKEKILNYLKQRIQYIGKMMNLHNLSIESMRRVQPALEELRESIREEEILLIAGMLQKGMKSGQLKHCDTERVASTILTVAEAVKLKLFQGMDPRFVDKVDYQKLEDEVVFAVSLILDGLMSERL